MNEQIVELRRIQSVLLRCHASKALEAAGDAHKTCQMLVTNGQSITQAGHHVLGRMVGVRGASVCHEGACLLVHERFERREARHEDEEAQVELVALEGERAGNIPGMHQTRMRLACSSAGS